MNDNFHPQLFCSEVFRYLGSLRVPNSNYGTIKNVFGFIDDLASPVTEKMTALLSIIIVNYRTADMLWDCLQSIQEQEIDAEIIIVDNDSGEHDRDILKNLARTYPFLKLILNSFNYGFSKANNQALAVSSGQYILFLNPDTFLFPFCLDRLISFFGSEKEIGCVIPKLWMDKERSFLLPPSYLPSLWGTFQNQVFMSSDFLLTRYFNRWLRKALSYWKADAPLPVEAISGAFFLTTKRIMETIGSFDERFPLYFEDSDLCRRIKQAGKTLYYYPDAEAVHFYNQSAKSSRESLEKFGLSERLYMEKHYHPYVIKMVWHLARLPKTKDRCPLKKQDVSAPVQSLPGGYLLFSSLRTMIPCVAHRMITGQFTFNSSFIENLAAGRYYLMVLRPDGTLSEKLMIEKS